jgi:hypothetical protein
MDDLHQSVKHAVYSPLVAGAGTTTGPTDRDRDRLLKLPIQGPAGLFDKATGCFLGCSAPSEYTVRAA